MFLYLKRIGLLRIGLIAIAIMLFFIRPEPGTTAARSGLEMIPTLVAPAMAPLVFMVLLFDIMMCRIRMSENSERRKFLEISYIEIFITCVLAILWLPFFLAIGK